MYHSGSEACSQVLRGLPLTKRKVSPMAVEGDTADCGSDAPDETAQQPNLSYLVGHRLAESGAHGIPNIQRANSRFRQIAWTVLFLTGFGMFIYQGCELTVKYYSWPINVNIEIRTLKKAQFPAVTWCNLNPIKKKALMEHPDLCALLRDTNTDCTPTNDSSSRSASEGYPTRGAVDFSEDSFYTTMEKSTKIVGALPYEERGETGHELENMLLRCTFQRHRCSPQNFSSFYNSRYGNCFTFNSGAEDVKPVDVTKTGPTYGLSLELYIQQDQYITGVETGAGVRILVHNQTDMPFPEDDGSNVSPGSETFIGLYRVLVNRLPQPYGDCATHFQPGNIFKEKFQHLEYTQEACEKDCYFQEVLKTCKCADVQYRYNYSQPACNTTENNQCMDEIEDSYTNSTLDCNHCHMNCNETRFELSYSSSMWPNREYKSSVEKNIKAHSNETIDFIRNNSLFVEENVLRVNVYYDDLNYDDIYQSEAYTLNDLGSDLGGQVGLWIGVSVLTVCEFIELMVDICVLVVAKCRAGGEMGRRSKKAKKVGSQS